MSKHILFDINQQVATITMNRPDVHNAFNEQTIESLTKAFVKAEQEKAVRVVVLKAAGKSFSAGADLEWMKRMADFDEEENYQDSLKLAQLMQAIDQCSKPTIAVVDGAAYGGGVGLVCACDIAIGVQDKALFCLSEVKLGLIPAVISPYVIRAIGPRQARRLFLTAEKVESQEALNLGFLTHLVTKEECDRMLKRIIDFLCVGAPMAQALCKKRVDEVNARKIDEELIKDTALWIAQTRSSKEAQLGIRAFLKKEKL